ncbi:MAG: phosphotransferase [Bacteroidales bacterium]|jgi:aminoglycoside/choline kinase family phosphotransferase|nr:phosphotransferase [Bacteroidales bacterium]
MNNPVEPLKQLFLQTFGREVEHVSLLETSGSERKYYRLQCGPFSAMGVYNADNKENRAFLALSRHFLSKGISVPVVYADNLAHNNYLISDLGDTTLYRRLCELRNGSADFPPQLIPVYKQALDKLLYIQTEGGKDFDFSLCYPRSAFDSQSILWDLNYFKYYFLKPAGVSCDEQLLENDFQTFVDFLSQANASFFLYRDFQSRNIMLHDDKLFFIDYQGGRKGALPYDVASLLYDGKANIPPSVRELLIAHYSEELQKKIPQEAVAFGKYYDAFVFIRMMQVMGAYGFRGLYEKKTHFLESIPYALKNMQWLLDNVRLPFKIPALWDVFHRLIQSETLNRYNRDELSRLKISIHSFSFKKHIPKDETDNGGGFVFDCRCLPNPAKHERYKMLTGKDQEVIAFMNAEPTVAHFFDNVKSIVGMAVKNYTDRKFRRLMICFGCTGGQHRSVYCAELLQDYLNKMYDVDTELHHQMENEWNKA